MKNTAVKTTAILLAIIAVWMVRSTAAAAPQGRSSEITGYLLEEGTRMPLEGIVVFHYGRGPKDIVGDEVRVGDDGSFVLRGIPRAAVFMVGTAKAHGKAVAFVLTDPGAPQVVELLLPRGATVEGVVRNLDGTPVPNVRISIKYTNKLADRLYMVQELFDQALAEGLDVVTVEPTHRALSGRDLGHVGKFALRDIDPRRPFRLVCEHEELGVIESELMYLDPGETYSGVTLAYQD